LRNPAQSRIRKGLAAMIDDYRLKAGRILRRLKVALRLKTPEGFPADSRLKAWWAL